ncbi:hypothetical protein OU5_1733 [Pseudomonas mandelii JR-1]|uniref:Uncharacterized protein n=1 Tax=Pseudomonas mandelii JR-1 TaxID=1147786 RepID=A0A024E7P7_9PSED|nr:hypothetical protein OU5_1733 [Pseudomonas mandelii JR-1]
MCHGCFSRWLPSQRVNRNKKTRRVSGALGSLSKISASVGARLAREGDLEDAFAGKPRS